MSTIPGYIHAIPLLYGLAGSLWIVITDILMRASAGETEKGLLFVWISAGLIWLMQSRALRVLRSSQLETMNAMDQLKEERETMRSILMEMPVLLVASDAEGRFVFWNRECQGVLGYTAEEMAVPNASAHLKVSDEYDHRMREAFNARVGDARGWEWQLRAKDGTTKTIAFSNIARSVSIPGWTNWAVGVDVTELVEAREANRNLNRNLEQKIAERTRDLELARDEIESFAYSVSHDLRAPLRSISGFSSAIMEDHVDALPQGAREYLERIRRAAERMAALIDDILKLARLSRGEVQRIKVDVSDICLRILQEYRSREPARKIDIRVAQGMYCNADPGMIRMLLENLIDNAWKFTGRHAAPAIEIGRVNDEFYVRDNGAGFDMQYASRLFTAFQRLHSEAEFPGTGIGLAIVKRAAQRHGGSVRAQSSPGEGAVFFFSLEPTA